MFPVQLKPAFEPNLDLNQSTPTLVQKLTQPITNDQNPNQPHSTSHASHQVIKEMLGCPSKNKCTLKTLVKGNLIHVVVCMNKKKERGG